MRFLLPLLVICSVSGCVLTPTAHKMDRLELGMSRQDVIGALGRPVSKGADPSGETLYYRFSETGADEINGIASAFFVKIVDGKVEAFGRVNDSSADYERRLKAATASEAYCPPPPVQICPPPIMPPPCICPATH
jgi:outer membrane protein assembly factor BamE (lipoprotein component of BamABCDE complex)